MRRIEKHPAPEWLQLNGPKMLADFDAGLVAKINYSHPQIKAALIAETGGTCAYCENEMDAVSYGEVEHIRPKDQFHNLILEWSNLTWACRVCNGKKGNYWDPDQPILDPTRDAPELHLEFHGPLLSVRDGSLLGEHTLLLLRLQRSKLFKARAAAIEVLADDLLRWQQKADPFKAALAEAIHNKLAEGAPFCTALRTFARAKQFPVDAPGLTADEV